MGGGRGVFPLEKGGAKSLSHTEKEVPKILMLFEHKSLKY